MFHCKVMFVVLMVCFAIQAPVVLGADTPSVLDVYSGSVPVNDRSQPSFRLGMNDALLQVLVKASAEQPDKLKKNPRLAEHLNNGERFAAQFLYKTRADVQADGSLKNQVYLQAAFPEKIIMGLLKNANVRFWSPPRSPLLILPVVNVGGLANMASSRDPLITPNLLNAGQKYAVPLSIGGDQQEDAQLIWNVDVPYINKLAAAANKTATLVLLLSGPGAAQGKWLLIDGTQVSKMDIAADTAAGFADKGLAWAASQLASKHSVALTSAATQFDLLVNGIDTYEKYEKALTYLKSISIVEALELSIVKEGSIQVNLRLTTGIDQLEKVFLADSNIRITVNADSQKNYHWNE